MREHSRSQYEENMRRIYNGLNYLENNLKTIVFQGFLTKIAPGKGVLSRGRRMEKTADPLSAQR